MTSPFDVLDGACCHLPKRTVSSGSLIHFYNRIADPHIWIADPFIKAVYAS
jgi:hypothetical protein